MLCFGDAICKHYSKYIQGKSISIGSFKNNMINSYPQNIKSKTILYISQFREKNKNTNVFISSSSLQISTEEFFSTEFYLLPKLYTFCKINGFRLQICGCSNSQSNHEISYYNNVFHDSDWDYFSKENIFDSYKLIDIADYVVTIDSTLGYEAFARGKKVAFFTCRGNYLKIQGADFGWPLNITKKGEFWTNEINDFEINRVLNFVTNVQSNIWESLKLKFMPDLINFDKQNQKFIKILIEEGFLLARNKILN
jgi:surface carbohydrate biosynthesis protein